MKTKWFSTLIEKLNEQNEKRPEKTAIKIHKKSGKEDISFGELWNGSHNIAQKLKEEGIEKQSRVAIFGEHSISWALIFVASRRLGATVTPIDINHNGKEIESQLRDCEPDIIIYAKKDVGSEPHQAEALTKPGFKSKTMSEMAYALKRNQILMKSQMITRTASPKKIRTA